MNYFKKIINNYKIGKILLSITTLSTIAVILDFFNIPSFLYEKLGIAIIFFLSIIIIVKVFDLRLLSLFKIKSVNYIDYYSVLVLFSSLLYSIGLFLFESLLYYRLYKLVLIIIISVICLIISLLRFLIYSSAIKKIDTDINVFDLKDLYDNKIPKKCEFLLINDNEADYDLLERDKIINQLQNTIINCHNDSKFVIGLKGAWGSGKTTILNNIKRKIKDDNIIIIDEFEPWTYQDEKTLLIGFFDVLMKKINCGFSINEIEKFTKTYIKSVSENSGYSLEGIFNSEINITRIKNIINDYLETNNTRIVLIVDNLERCNSDHIIFILKIIHSILNFKRIIYILSYDDNILKKHFERLDIDYSYIEKIIQMEFNVPIIEQSIIKNIVTRCLSNYLQHSKFIIEPSDKEKLVNELSLNIKDLRDLKRLINSTFNFSFGKEKYLNSYDTLMIESIYLKNPALWKDIYENRKFYISEDQYIFDNSYFLGTDKFNSDATKYFNELFNNNKFNVNDYTEILEELFPHVKQYKEETKIYPKNTISFISEGYFYDKNAYQESVRNKRIFNGKFFELYFNKTENEFIKIDNEVRNFILNINADDYDLNKLYSDYEKMEKIFPGWLEKYTLETFQMFLDKIRKDKLRYLFFVIYNYYYKTDTTPLFFQANASFRTQVILADILLLMTDDDFKQTTNFIQNDIKNLYLLREITYWLNPQNRKNEIIDQTRYTKLSNLYEKILSKVKSKKINLYTKNNYNRYNGILLFEDIDYMNSIIPKINKSNLMLFLLDCITISTGSYGIGYKFEIERIDKFYGWENIKKDIHKCKESELKTFLIKAIETPNPYQSTDEDNTYHVSEWIDLNDLIIKFLNR